MVEFEVTFERVVKYKKKMKVTNKMFEEAINSNAVFGTLVSIVSENMDGAEIVGIEPDFFNRELIWDSVKRGVR